MENQGSKKINKLAVGLSKEFNTTTLSIIVHDSDFLYLGINTDGIQKDFISNFFKEIEFIINKPSD